MKENHPVHRMVKKSGNPHKNIVEDGQMGKHHHHHVMSVHGMKKDQNIVVDIIRQINLVIMYDMHDE